MLNFCDEDEISHDNGTSTKKVNFQKKTGFLDSMRNKSIQTQSQASCISGIVRI